MYVIVFKNCITAESAYGRFCFLVKLQAVDTPQDMFPWNFLKIFSYTSVHPSTAASFKLKKPNMGKTVVAKSK